MNNKFDITRAPQTPLRAERDPRRDGAGHIRGVEATSGGLIRSTLIASGAAAAILSIVYLPAEYGISSRQLELQSEALVESLLEWLPLNWEVLR